MTAAETHVGAAAEAAKSAQRASELRRDAARFAATTEASGGTETRGYDALSYAIDGRFDWDAEVLHATVTIKAKLTDADLETLTLDSRVAAIETVTLNKTISPSYVVDAAEGRLAIDLAGLDAAARAQELILKIRYRTNANETATSPDSFDPGALRSIKARVGDPVKARTLNTMSEPRSAAFWMPSNDRPDDRARFSIKMTMDPVDTLVANGDLLDDTRLADGRRVMRYATKYSLPTYLMAFAQGELEATKGIVGNLPIGVYARRGLALDGESVVAELQRLITRFQELVGPYPFDKYFIVFLPEFGGGEEHAGITFQSETWGTDVATAGDRSMIAHELGHQWFGDYVTVSTWDDLWIKEGMATLLESESGRPYADQQHTGRLFGREFFVESGDAIVDPALAPEDKYTSGPYGRSAWLLTQLRAELGDDAFWSILRQTLKRHAYGHIGTDEFLAAFEPRLGAEFIAKAKVALKAHAMPKIEAAATTGDAVALTLTDPEGALLLPLPLVDTTLDGRTTVTQLAHGGTAVVDVEIDGVAALDSRDVHPWNFFDVDAAQRQLFEKALTPRGGVTPKMIATLAPSQQEAVFNLRSAWLLDGRFLRDVMPLLGSEIAKASALGMGCKAAKHSTDGTAQALWATTVETHLSTPPLLGVTSWYFTPDLSACPELLPEAFFTDRLDAFQTSPVGALTTNAELEYLSSLPFEPSRALAVWGSVATHAGTPRARATAAAGLLAYLRLDDDAATTHTRPAPEDVPHWQVFFRELLTDDLTGEVLRQSMAAPTLLQDLAAVPALASVVKRVPYTPTQRRAVCNAYQLTGSDAAAWEAFKHELADTALVPRIAALLENPVPDCN
jgi:hypothetical protein